MSLRIVVIDDIDQNRSELISAWAKFDAQNIPSGLELDAIVSWMEKYGRIENSRIGYNKQPIIILIYDMDILLGILPLMRVVRYKKGVMKVTTLEFLTQSFSGNYLDIIQRSMTAEQVAVVFKLIKKKLRYDMLDFSYLKENSLLLAAKVGFNVLHAGKVLIPLCMDYKKIRAEIYSKNLRHILNKFKRRIRESKEVIRSEIIEGRENIKGIKEAIIQVSLSKLKDQYMHSLYENPILGDLYFDTILKSKKPFCSVYYSGNQLLSYNLGYIMDDVVYAFDAAYNRNYADSQKIGLGILAYDSLVERYAGIYKELDMGFGLDDYKFRFSKKVFFTRSLILKGNTLKAGALYNKLRKKRLQLEKDTFNRIKKYTGLSK